MSMAILVCLIVIHHLFINICDIRQFLYIIHVHEFIGYFRFIINLGTFFYFDFDFIFKYLFVLNAFNIYKDYNICLFMSIAIAYSIR